VAVRRLQPASKAVAMRVARRDLRGRIAGNRIRVGTYNGGTDTEEGTGGGGLKWEGGYKAGSQWGTRLWPTV